MPPGCVLRPPGGLSLLLPLLSLLLLSLSSVHGAVSCFQHLSRADFPFCQSLSPSYALHWALEADTIRFGVVVEGGGWGYVGLGLSEGGMVGADIWVVHAPQEDDDDEEGTGGAWAVKDYFSMEEAMPIEDAPGGQDVQLLSVQQGQGTTVAIFQRKLDTCNTTNDIAILNDTDSQVIFAYGNRWGYHGENRGNARIRFAATNWDPSNASNDTASYWLDMNKHIPDVMALPLTMPGYVVPAKRTTYTCFNVEVPSDRKYHMIRYNGIADSKLIHHVVLYACNKKPEATEPYSCYSPPAECSYMWALWANGFGNATLPPEAGLPFGDTSYKYLALQIHYNNPELIEGTVDSSGLMLYYTPVLRPNDMGMLVLGSYDIHVPPGKNNYSIPSNLCPSECTEKMVPPGQKLNLVTNMLHMHEAGQAVVTQHIRKGVELPPLGYRKHFSFDWQYAQDILPGSRTLEPGDALITTCSYNTTDRSDVTEFGLGSEEEMCYNFLWYWPAVDGVQECISYSSDEFGSMSSCTAQSNMPDWGDDDDVEDQIQSLIEGGDFFKTDPLPAYTPYAPSCSKVSASFVPSAAPPPPDADVGAGVPLPISYHTGPVIGSIVAITAILGLAGFILFRTYAKHDEDPERLKLISDLEDQLKRGFGGSDGGERLELVSSGEWGEMKGGEPISLRPAAP